MRLSARNNVRRVKARYPPKGRLTQRRQNEGLRDKTSGRQRPPRHNAHRNWLCRPQAKSNPACSHTKSRLAALCLNRLSAYQANWNALGVQRSLHGLRHAVDGDRLLLAGGAGFTSTDPLQTARPRQPAGQPIRSASANLTPARSSRSSSTLPNRRKRARRRFCSRLGHLVGLAGKRNHAHMRGAMPRAHNAVLVVALLNGGRHAARHAHAIAAHDEQLLDAVFVERNAAGLRYQA